MKNGFTLIELLAVIIILSVILLITVISVNSTLISSKKNIFTLQQKNIEEAAKTYYLKEGILYENDCISVADLIKKGYIEGENIINPETKEEMKGFVKISYEANQYSYKYQESSCIIYTAVTSPTTGIVPVQDENGNIKAGSEFKVRVNENMDELIFFVLSNEGDYVNLIAQKNLKSDGTLAGENQTGDEWYVSSAQNKYGPLTAYTYLSNATSNWVNIPIIQNFEYENSGYDSVTGYGYKKIEVSYDSNTGNYITSIMPNSESLGEAATYTNLRVRLPYEEEILNNTSCTSIDSSCDDSSLWVTDYLKTSSSVVGGTSSSTYSSAYWLLTTSLNSDANAQIVASTGQVAVSGSASGSVDSANFGIRPVITIPKAELVKAITKNK